MRIMFSRNTVREKTLLAPRGDGIEFSSHGMGVGQIFAAELRA